MKNVNQKILLVSKWLIIFLLFIFSYQKVSASIIFSEVAWMGGINSSTDEWIEIYNDGSDVNLDGYIIESESKKISIKLSGTISSKAYYLIERTDDNSVPNISADLISTFGTGLSNAGDNLYLKNSGGQVVDSLVFAGGWPAGDNTTKQTMQLTNGAWLTAEATPKKPPVGNQQNDQTSNLAKTSSTEADSSSSSNAIKGSGLSYVAPKNLSRFLITFGEGQFSKIPINVEVDYRDDYGNKPAYGLFRLNFGDGVEQDFKFNEPIVHTYEYAGDYKVTAKFLESAWSMLPKKQTSVNISIADPLIEIDNTKAPILIVKNKSLKDLDLGNFSFISNGKIFNPPNDSIVFSGKEVWISPKVTGFSVEDVKNLSVVSKNQTIIYEPILQNKTSNLVQVKNTTNRSLVKSIKNILPTQDLVQIQNQTLSQNLTANASQSDFVKKQKPNNLIAWLLFGALVVIGSWVFIKLRRVEVDESNDFTLLEE